jgi:spore germination cell wall hydrolase CwlJ-like protein
MQPAAAPTVQEMTPFAVRQVDPSEAQKLNASLPLASGPNPAAAPFVLQADSKTYARALECLSQAIYYEAAREAEDGQRAVAQVVLNRMRHPAYPASVCAVVYQGAERPTGCQFSFTCDGSLARAPMRGYWDRARKVAAEALKGYVHAPVGNATHYHADYVMPYWAPTLVKNAVSGVHIFYRWPGGWGQPSAFRQKWSRRESDPKLLRTAALAAEARHDAAELAAKVEVPEAVAAATEALPPELARLVEAETGAGGKTRLSLTIPQSSPKDPAKAEPSSISLEWGLTGRAAETAQEAPLGRKAEDSVPAAPAAGTAATNE